MRLRDFLAVIVVVALVVVGLRLAHEPTPPEIQFQVKVAGTPTSLSDVVLEASLTASETIVVPQSAETPLSDVAFDHGTAADRDLLHVHQIEGYETGQDFKWRVPVRRYSQDNTLLWSRGSEAVNITLYTYIQLQSGGPFYKVFAQTEFAPAVEQAGTAGLVSRAIGIEAPRIDTDAIEVPGSSLIKAEPPYVLSVCGEEALYLGKFLIRRGDSVTRAFELTGQLYGDRTLEVYVENERVRALALTTPPDEKRSPSVPK